MGCGARKPSQVANVEEQRTAMIKPGYHAFWGTVIDGLAAGGVTIVEMKSLRFDDGFAAQFCAEHAGPNAVAAARDQWPDEEGGHRRAGLNSLRPENPCQRTRNRVPHAGEFQFSLCARASLKHSVPFLAQAHHRNDCACLSWDTSARLRSLTSTFLRGSSNRL
jgi:hypothetical protein